MSFPTGWKRRVAITIPAAQVGSGGVSDFTVTLTRDSLPDAMCDPSGGNAAQSNGGDIRASLDDAGATQVALDIISFEHDSVSEAGDAEVQISVGPVSLSSASDNTIYLWYSTTSTESQPSADDTYGSDNAYDSDTALYSPMRDVTSSTVGDRTSNGATGSKTASNRPNEVDGQIGKAQETTQSEDRINFGSGAAIANIFSGGGSILFWTRLNSLFDFSDAGTSMWAYKQDNQGWQLAITNSWATNSWAFSRHHSTDRGEWHGPNNAIAPNQNYLVALTYNEDSTSNSPVFYINGVISATSTRQAPTGTVQSDSDSPLYTHDLEDVVRTLDGWMGELSLHTTIRSAAWIETYYNNTSDPGTFAVAGEPVSTAIIPPPVLNMQMIG